MQDFFSSTAWIIISAIMSIFGVIGTLLAIYQYLKSAKELQEYKYLFKIAGQHVDLEDKKNQIIDYKNQIMLMQKTIKEQIPEEAKKIALMGILENELQVLSSTYTKVKTLQSELESLTSDDILETNELMKNVNKIIEPAYSKNRSDSILSSAFYMVSVTSSFLSMILSRSVYQMVIVVVLLFQLVIGIRTMINLLKLNYTRKELSDIIYKCLLVGAIIFLAVALIFLLFPIGFEYYADPMVFLTAAISAYGIHLLLGFMYFLKENKKKLIIWLALCFLSLISIIVSLLFSLTLLYIFGILIIIVDIVFLYVCYSDRKNLNPKHK